MQDQIRISVFFRIYQQDRSPALAPLTGTGVPQDAQFADAENARTDVSPGSKILRIFSCQIFPDGQI